MDDLSRQYYCRNLKVIQEFRKTLLDCLSVVDGTKLNLEKTGDGCYTCQFEKPSGGQIYLYSKFKPLEIARKAISKYPLIGQKNFLVLGLGLGYELAELHRLSGELFEQIIVIENKAELFYLFLHTGDYSDILSDPRITFIIGSASELVLPTNSLTVIENANLTVLAPGYYQKIVAEINFFLKKNTANRVIVFDHVTFADDVSQALKHLSFEVSKMKLIPDLDAMAAQIKEGTPRFLFSINLNPSILRIANHLGIPYISWTVDTPSANLFHDDNKSPYAMLFIYERESVKRLRQDGFQNVYYLPAAANVERYENLVLSPEGLSKYSCDISFIGTTGQDNEFARFYKGKLDAELDGLLNRIAMEQLKYPNKYVVPELIAQYNRRYNTDITQAVYRQSRIELGGNDYTGRDERFSYVLAKEICSYWRHRVIAKIAANYDIHVYGDTGWELLKPALPRLDYKGFANHFTEVPIINRVSKINLNLTRLYVESGLPMRVFDTLAAGGFLLTNHKKDLDDLFEPGKDLIVFNDEKELLEAIEYYLNRKEERETIAKRGHDTVKSKHTFVRRMKHVLELFFQRDFSNQKGC